MILIMFHKFFLALSQSLAFLPYFLVRAKSRKNGRENVFGDWYLISADISHLTLAAPINYLPLPSPHDNFSNNHYSGPKLLKWSSRIKQRTNICTVSTHNYCSILLILFSFHNVFGLMKTSHFVSSQSKAVD